MVRLGFAAFDVTIRFPLTLPEDCGVNATVNVALCPAVSVVGAVIPLRAYPAPLIPT
jgi:hypothetical protein